MGTEYKGLILQVLTQRPEALAIAYGQPGGEDPS